MRIPNTIEDARTALTSIEGLLTAKQWERAAIVYAFTRNEGRGGDNRSNVGYPTLTMAQFAKLKISGLTTRETVAHYRGAWQEAVDKGEAIPAMPGTYVKVPNLPWPPNPTVGRNVDPSKLAALNAQANADGVGASKVIDVASNPRAVAAAMRADPDFRDKVMELGVTDAHLAKEAEKRPQVRIQVSRTALGDSSTARKVMADPKTRASSSTASWEASQAEAKAAGRKDLSVRRDQKDGSSPQDVFIFTGEIRKASVDLRSALRMFHEEGVRLIHADEIAVAMDEIDKARILLDHLAMAVNGTVTDQALEAFLNGGN